MTKELDYFVALKEIAVSGRNGNDFGKMVFRIFSKRPADGAVFAYDDEISTHLDAVRD